MFAGWGVWFQNRVEVIQGNTSPGSWFHVPSTSNLSDISTRSISLNHLEFIHWLHGSRFLLDHQENWLLKQLVLSAETKSEEWRTDLVVNMVGAVCHGIGEVINCNNYNSSEKLLRITSYFLRLKGNILSKLRKKPAIFATVCHSGVTSTLNFIRSKFWAVKERQTVKKILKKQFICKYVNGKTLLEPATPSLPDFEVKCNHSFEFVGVDFAGPS